MNITTRNVVAAATRGALSAQPSPALPGVYSDGHCFFRDALEWTWAASRTTTMVSRASMTWRASTMARMSSCFVPASLVTAIERHDGEVLDTGLRLLVYLLSLIHFWTSV